jgi:hypothetical protein
MRLYRKGVCPVTLSKAKRNVAVLVLVLLWFTGAEQGANGAFVVKGPAGTAFGSVDLANGGINEDGREFWDNKSWDGPQRNIGYFLTKTGSYYSTQDNANSPGILVSNLQYFQGSSYGANNAPASTTYGTGAVTNNIKILIEVAGLSNQNQLWYEQNGKLTRIFNGSDGANQMSSVSITGEFNLYLIRGTTATSLTTGQLSTLTYAASSGTSYVPPGADQQGESGTTYTEQHFVTFRDNTNTEKLYVGIEDIVPLPSADKDYNDMIISMQVQGAQVVPAPSSFVMFMMGGASLIGFVLLRRRNPVALVA